MPPVLHGQAEAGGHRRPGRALRAPLRPPRQEVLTDLTQVKLRAVVASHWGAGDRVPEGRGLIEGDRGWFLADASQRGRLGAALAWARRHSIRELHVVADAGEGASALARRAGAFSAPPNVWALAGRELIPARADALPPDPPVAEDSMALAPVLEAAGAEPVVEHGALRGEVLGLEVARVTGGRLEAGVGAHDREALAELRPGGDPVEALREVVATVRRFRAPGVQAHPANLYARERWLRAVLVAHPELAGVGPLRALPSPERRTDLRAPAPAPAAGAGVVVVASTGVDVDLVPAAADVRLRHDPSARLLLVVPEGDDHPLTRDLAAALAVPADVRTVSRAWPEATPP